jgi:endonuclease III
MMLQELLLEQDRSGWRMLVGCILLNQTARVQVDGVYPELFDRWPSALAMSKARIATLERVLQPLGLQHRRAAILKRFAWWWNEAGGDVGREELGQWAHRAPDFGERVRAMEPPGIGEYARDSWIIFMEGIVPGHAVHDKELLKHLQRSAGASVVVWR